MIRIKAQLVLQRMEYEIRLAEDLAKSHIPMYCCQTGPMLGWFEDMDDASEKAEQVADEDGSTVYGSTSVDDPATPPTEPDMPAQEGPPGEPYNTNEIEEGSHKIDHRSITVDSEATEYVQSQVKEKLDGKTRSDGEPIELGANGLNIDNIVVLKHNDFDNPADFNDTLVEQIVLTATEGSDKNYKALCKASNATYKFLNETRFISLGYHPSDKLFGLVNGTKYDINNGFISRNTYVRGKRTNVVLWDHNTTYGKEEKVSIFGNIPLIGRLFSKTHTAYFTPYHTFQHETYHVKQKASLGAFYHFRGRTLNEFFCMKAVKYSKLTMILNLDDSKFENIMQNNDNAIYHNFRHHTGTLISYMIVISMESLNKVGYYESISDFLHRFYFYDTFLS